jgi:uncharacterized membrane protein
MSVSQPPTDTPFGLQPNVAAGLAYLLGLIGGIIMLVGGGTNKFVKWAACQSITMFGLLFVIWIAWSIAVMLIHPLLLLTPVMWLVDILWFVLWIWTFVTAFQGKEVRVPVIDGLTENLFKSQLS